MAANRGTHDCGTCNPSFAGDVYPFIREEVNTQLNGVPWRPNDTVTISGYSNDGSSVNATWIYQAFGTWQLLLVIPKARTIPGSAK